ncbi:MAG: hypothetical protein OHK0052_02790 [Anaerolineales bacterium]
MRKIAIALSKGGVGKTTTAVNLAAGLAAQGRRVLLVDVDTQGHVARALGTAPSQGLAELVSGEAPRESCIHTARPNLDLLAGGRSLAGLKRLITRQDFGGERTLAEGIAKIDAPYEFVLLDTAPGWDALTVNALFYAEEVLAPVSLEALTLQGLNEFGRSMAAIQKYHAELRLRYIVPTFYDRRVRKSEEILAQLQQHYPAEVCAPVRYNVRLSEAPGYGQTIFEYAARSSGAEDYAALVERILQ